MDKWDIWGEALKSLGVGVGLTMQLIGVMKNGQGVGGRGCKGGGVLGQGMQENPCPCFTKDIQNCAFHTKVLPSRDGPIPHFADMLILDRAANTSVHYIYLKWMKLISFRILSYNDT